jgi:hypothetical protein
MGKFREWYDKYDVTGTFRGTYSSVKINAKAALIYVAFAFLFLSIFISFVPYFSKRFNLPSLP